MIVFLLVSESYTFWCHVLGQQIVYRFICDIGVETLNKSIEHISLCSIMLFLKCGVWISWFLKESTTLSGGRFAPSVTQSKTPRFAYLTRPASKSKIERTSPRLIEKHLKFLCFFLITDSKASSHLAYLYR